jgi:hypothetical protein
VLVLGELALWLGANPERGRIRSYALGKILLDLLQLPKELVVRRIGYGGTIEDVVLV